MKTNINLMNSEIDESVINQFGKEYILQALANLGQRIGIKGDGLNYRSFKFIELLNNEDELYSTDDNIGYIEYSNNSAIIGINNISTNVDTILTNLIDKNIGGTLISNREFSFTIPVNNIEKYSKNTIISNNDNILTIITVGKKIGYSDDDENNAVLFYYKFNTSTNKLIYALKSGFINSDSEGSHYYLLKIDQSIDNEGNVKNNKYELITKVFNTKYLNDSYKALFGNTYCFDNYNNDFDQNLTLPFLNSEFLDIKNLESYNNNVMFNYDSNSPISIILNNEYNLNYNKSYILDLILDTSLNQFLSVSEDEYEKIINLYNTEYNFVNIAEEINFFNNDITELYENMFRYYNEKYYIDNRTTFIKRILCMLYEHVYDNLHKEDNTLEISDLRLYIPLNYNINYICNSNNELYIYYSNDLYLLLTNLSNSYNRSAILKNKNYLIIDYNGIDKVQSYKFEIEYNNLFDNIINSIDIKNIYTMPFVDFDENWNVNGYNTNIRAVGKNAGNPNIIIINSINKEEYKILSSISNNVDLNTLEFKLVEFNLHKNLFTNLLSNDNTKCYAWIPILNKDNYEIFENSVIINISDLNCLDNKNNIEYYLGANIITIWNYTVNNNKYDFTVITNTDGYVLPLGVTHNLQSKLEGTTLLNLNEQELLILKAKLINELGQTIVNNNSYNWGIIKNKNSVDYNPDKSNEDYEYNNDLNAIIEYTDNLTLENSTATYSNINKYIPDINNIKNTGITNILYPEYSTEIKPGIASVDNIMTSIKKVLETVESTQLTIEGDTYKVENNIYDIISNKLEKKYGTTQYTYSSKKIVPTTINGIKQYYKEYIFNSNVPTIDFKEIFLRNVNTLNRYNIITLDNNGNVYYSYLGSNYNEEDKNVLHLSSLNKNINVGTDTLMELNDVDEFKTQDTISIDFDNIKLNGAKTISKSKNSFIDKLIRGVHYYSTEYNIIDNKASKPFENLYTSLDTNNRYFRYKNSELYDFYSLSKSERIGYCLNSSGKYIYLIYLNGIINDILNIDIEDTTQISQININCSTNQLIALLKQDLVSYKGEYGYGHDFTPKFFLRINDKLTTEDNGVVLSTDSLRIIVYKKYYQGSYIINIICRFNDNNLSGTLKNDNKYDAVWKWKTNEGLTFSEVSNDVQNEEPTPTPIDPERQSPQLSWDNPDLLYTGEEDYDVLPVFQNPHDLNNITFESDKPNIITVNNNGELILMMNNIIEGESYVVNITAHRDRDDIYEQETKTCKITIQIPQSVTYPRTGYYYYIGRDENNFIMNNNTNFNDYILKELYNDINNPKDEEEMGWKYVEINTNTGKISTEGIRKEILISNGAYDVSYFVMIPQLFNIYSTEDEIMNNVVRTITIKDKSFNPIGEDIVYCIHQYRGRAFSYEINDPTNKSNN